MGPVRSSAYKINIRSCRKRSITIISISNAILFFGVWEGGQPKMKREHICISLEIQKICPGSVQMKINDIIQSIFNSKKMG